MYIYEQETKFGTIKWLYADMGKKLLINNELLDKVAMGVNAKLEDFVEIDDADYIPPEIPQEDEELSLTELQENQIKLSKSNLSTYLEDNPLFSTIKYEEGKYYTVTQEKQNLLVRELFKHFLDPQATLYWNSTGESYEEWTFEELKSLKTEIENYVRPLVQRQQELEKEIRKGTSSIDILNIELDPYKEVYR